MGDVANKEGRTVLFVSHNMGAIRNLCETGILINQGQIKESGLVDQVVSNYNNGFFLDTNIKNKFHVDTEFLPHSGTGEAKILWVEIINSEGKGTLEIQMDEKFKIQLGIQNPHGIKLAYAIEIIDKNDYPLFHIWSGFDKVGKLPAKTGTPYQIAEVTIPSLELFPDTYFANAWIGKHTQRIDKVDRCMKFEIIKNPSIKEDLLSTRGRIYKRGMWKESN